MAEKPLNEAKPRPWRRFFVVSVLLIGYCTSVLCRHPHLSNLELNILHVGAPLLVFYGFLKLLIIPMMHRKAENEPCNNLLKLKTDN
jgi:hypothetical protein